ncbi:hemerythrin domain-containing protein [Streptomyces marispadix]|uniref:Hemerythrin domain-containing protein n=1 Tax=Streptomyces marispadix TaxID=2922868 RepID=A0ABS9SZF9_9ACTN|nr:hemerythrin domain-containing protein [Streptomyces marispadix]MCH6161674.1 hemerythrin domain-containing protein [Streptomyces marispadix]
MSNAALERAEAAKLPHDDIIAVLLTQHARMRDLFAEVHVSLGEEKRAKFAELRALLAVHEAAEEMILRPVAKREAGEREAVARNEEEEEAGRILAELERMDPDGSQFEAKLGEFEKAVGEHADHEEREEFPAVRTGCSQEQRQKMGKRLLRAERTAPTHPHPAAAGSPAAQWAVGPFASLLDRARDAMGGGTRPRG